jgi:hypothetical protein
VDADRRSTIDLDVGAADLTTVEAIARIELAARRLGCDVLVHGASSELLELLALVGLDGVLRRCRLCLEPRGEPEQGEEPLGGEEERELGDSAT